MAFRIAHAALISLSLLCVSHVSGVIPEDFVLTASGYIHKSCISFANSDHEFIDAVSASLLQEPCRYSRIPLLHSQQNSSLNYYSGWNAFVGYTHTNPIVNFSTWWKVPARPPKYNPLTTIFFFNGLQDRDHHSELILQPVLQYGISGCGGGDYWSLRSFFVGGTGRAVCGKNIRVKEGDQVSGYIYQTDSTGRRYTVLSQVLNGKSSSLTVELPQTVQSLPYACLTMEGIRIYSCSAFPNSGPLIFQDVYIASGALTSPRKIFPSWQKTITHNDCDQDVQINKDGSVVIEYRSVKNRCLE